MISGMSEADGPATEALRQLMTAFGQAMTDWAERMRPAFDQLTRALADPQVRAALEAARDYRPCHCWCTRMHPADPGICEAGAAVTSRRFDSLAHGPVDVQLCAPCAVAQGLAELAR